jgi:hypothetical protein
VVVNVPYRREDPTLFERAGMGPLDEKPDADPDGADPAGAPGPL